MRIFVAVKHSRDSQYFYGELWSGNFYPALQELGCEIIESKVDLFPASRFMHIAKDFTPEEREVRNRITQQIVEEIKKAHRDKPIDLFLSYFYNAHFDPSGFEAIHQLGIPTVNFYCNSIYQFEFVSEIAKRAEFSWHTEKAAQLLYLKAGANPVWVQMGADPKIYHPIAEAKRQSKACFVGQRYADRDRYLAKLIENRIPVDIFGHGWKNAENGKFSGTSETTYLGRKILKPGKVESYLQVLGQNFEVEGFVGGSTRTFGQWQYRRESRRLDSVLAQAVKGPAPDVCQTFNEYEVALNFSNVWADGRSGSQLVPHGRLRDFEAPMSRACYLTGYSDEIAEFYEIGKEIDAYHTPEELIDKTRFYLSHPNEAEKLRAAGYQKARQDHTWVKRFEELFLKIGISKTREVTPSFSPTILPISAVVPTRNRHFSLERMLKSLALQSAQPHEIIIVDASTDGETERFLKIGIPKLQSQVVYHRAVEVGAATQRNQAMESVSQNFVCFIDDDVIFKSECMNRLWKAIQSDSQLGGVSAMITNQRYLSPSFVSRLLFQFLNGRPEASYAGKCLGPVLNLLPEDRPNLPEVVSVEWVSTSCALFRRASLPDPPFPCHKTKYSRTEDIALSLVVGRKWKLANARTARIFHDSQGGDHKDNIAECTKVGLLDRHHLMTNILGRRDAMDYFKLITLELFELFTSLTTVVGLRAFPRILEGKLKGVWKILRG